MTVPQDLIERRNKLMTTCGLDAFARSASDWLKMSVAAEERGSPVMQRDYFEAAEIREARAKALQSSEQSK